MAAIKVPLTACPTGGSTGGKICFQAHSVGCWQDFCPCGCVTEGSGFLQAGGWRPHAVPCLMGFLSKAAHLVQPARRVSLDRGGPSNHLRHILLVRSGSQLLPGVTQGCERQGAGNRWGHNRVCPPQGLSSDPPPPSTVGPDPAPPAVPASLWVPVSGTGHPRKTLSVSIFLKREAPLICRTLLSCVYTF